MESGTGDAAGDLSLGGTSGAGEIGAGLFSGTGDGFSSYLTTSSTGFSFPPGIFLIFLKILKFIC